MIIILYRMEAIVKAPYINMFSSKVTKLFLFRIRKRYLKFAGHMRKDSSENMTLTEHIEFKTGKGKLTFGLSVW